MCLKCLPPLVRYYFLGTNRVYACAASKDGRKGEAIHAPRLMMGSLRGAGDGVKR